ncbi:MAG: FapA family protein [Syntrophomonadaceae bacterium]
MSEQNMNKDGQVKISFGPGKMYAFLEVTAPIGEGVPCKREQVLKALKDHEIVYGINDSVIDQALQQQNWNKRLLVAKGLEPESGTDGKLIYKFPLPQERLKLQEDEKGNIDYRERGLIYNVKMGELLVERIPPTEGTPGRDVTNREIPPKRGRDYHLPRGKNTVADQEQRYLFANCDGYVTLADGKVVVEPVLVIGQDVDFATGNIDFIGNVVIYGNIAPGFKVHASGDIEIEGFVEAAEVIAGGSIHIKGGITTGAKGLIKAGQNIYARFIENSTVEAGGDIVVRDFIMQSLVRSGGSIKVTDHRARIVGGTVLALDLVESKVLGSQLATQTIVEVGINPHLREEYQVLIKNKAEKKKVYDNLQHSLRSYQRSNVSLDNLSDKKRLALIKMLDDFKTLRGELDSCEARIAYLESEFEKTHNAKVRALQIVYPGVRITIGQSVYTVNDPIKYAQFINEDGEVRLTSLS